MKPEDDRAKPEAAPPSLESEASPAEADRRESRKRRARRTSAWDETLLDGVTLVELVQIARTVLGFLRSYWAWGVLPLVAGALAGALWAVMVKSPSPATFDVRLVPTANENPVAKFERSNVEYFRSAEQNFRSLPLIAKTLDALGESSPSMARLDEVQKRLLFYAIGHQTYTGRYSGPDEDWSLAFLKGHVKTYLESEIAKTLRVIKSEAEFLERHLKKVEQEQEASEQALRRFKEQHSDGLPEHAKEHTLVLQMLRRRKRECLAKLSRMRLELKLNRDKIKGEKLFVESKVISTQRAQPYQTAITEVNLKIARAQAGRMKGNHPEMKRLKRLKELLHSLSEQSSKRSKTEIETGRNPIYESIQDTIYQLEVSESVALKELEDVESALEKTERIVARLPELEARYADLTRAYATNSQLYDQIFKQLKVTRLQLDLERASSEARYELITPPRSEYSSLKKRLIVRVALLAFLGLFAGMAAAILREIKRRVQRSL